MKSNNYLIFSGISIGVYLIVEFTEIYGHPTWFKAFSFILGATFLISGISLKQKEKNAYD